jgi:hypothetical protein
MHGTTVKKIRDLFIYLFIYVFLYYLFDVYLTFLSVSGTAGQRIERCALNNKY